MTWFLIGVACVWLFVSITGLLSMRAAPELPAWQDVASVERLPPISVIFAARDEQSRIEQTVLRLLAQELVEIEVIAVDDRSRDGTRRMLQRLANEQPRLRVVCIDELPAGWLGKCHALHCGVKLASHDWLLFTDADIHMVPDLLARAVATAHRDAASHLTLWPGLGCRSWLARATVLAWAQMILLYAPARKINNDRGTAGAGVGAFNLLQRSTYDAIGGHEALRMEVVDDMKLGLLVRRGGFRQRVYDGARLLTADWPDSALGLIRVVEKNWFAGINFSTWFAAAIIVCFFLLWFGAILGPLFDSRWGWLPLAALLSTILPGLRQAPGMGWPKAAALGVPLGLLFFPIAGLNSTARTLLQGGVQWRDTFYSLSELRQGLVK